VKVMFCLEMIFSFLLSSLNSALFLSRFPPFLRFNPSLNGSSLPSP
jgi:hypothetical protein